MKGRAVGTIQQRTNTWRVRFYVDGKARYRGGFRTEDDARRFLKKTIKQVYTEKYVDPAETPTVNVLVDAYLRYLEVNQAKSLVQVRSHAAHVRREFGDLLVTSVKTADVREFQEAQLARGKSRATVNRETEVLRAALRLAHRDESSGVKALPHIPRLKRENNKKSQYISADLFEAIVGELPAYMKGFVRFMYWTGWRPSMARALTWDPMVDRAEGTILLPDSKNNDPQRIPILGKIATILDEQWATRAYDSPQGARVSEYVFHRSGRPIGDIRKSWRVACQKNGISGMRDSGITPKALRNTFATNASEARIPRDVIRELAGWKSDSMFYRYVIGTQDRKRSAMEALERHLAAERERLPNVRAFRGKKSEG